MVYPFCLISAWNVPCNGHRKFYYLESNPCNYSFPLIFYALEGWGRESERKSQGLRARKIPVFIEPYISRE